MGDSSGSSSAAISNTNPHEQYEESFVDHNWVQMYGLDEHKVLAYFSCSQFYDRRCNNETLTMQNKDLSFLKKMKGLEYQVIRNPQEPRLFIIAKQLRKSGTQVHKLAQYYVLDKVIYQSPNLTSLLLSRTQKCTNHLLKAFRTVQDAVQFTPSEGYTWSFPKSDNAQEWTTSSEVAAYELKHKRARVEEEDKKASKKVNALLKDLVRTYAPDANTHGTGTGSGMYGMGASGSRATTLQSGMSAAGSTNASEMQL